MAGDNTHSTPGKRQFSAGGAAVSSKQPHSHSWEWVSHSSIYTGMAMDPSPTGGVREITARNICSKSGVHNYMEKVQHWLELETHVYAQ